MRLATYHYRMADYKGGYTAHKVRVEVIGESGKCYHVRYVEPGAFGQPCGSTKWVRRRNVALDRPETPASIPVNNTRMPYKD